MSRWDAGIDPANQKLLVKAREYIALQDNIDKLKEKLGRLKAEITEIVPEEIGDVERQVGNTTVVVSRSSRNNWDHEMLKMIFNEHEPLPSHVTKKLIITKDKYQKLPPEEQRKVHPALTVTPGPMSIRIEGSAT